MSKKIHNYPLYPVIPFFFCASLTLSALKKFIFHLPAPQAHQWPTPSYTTNPPPLSPRLHSAPPGGANGVKSSQIQDLSWPMIAPRARETELPKVPARSDSQMFRFFLRYAYAAVATVRQPLHWSLDTPEALNSATRLYGGVKVVQHASKDCVE
jgi:hypothetical protein